MSDERETDVSFFFFNEPCWLGRYSWSFRSAFVAAAEKLGSSSELP